MTELTGLASGRRQLGFAALQDRIRRAAVGFAELGIGPGDAVALLLRNDFPFLEATFAAQWLGGYAVPINWHFKAEEVRFILDDSGAKVLLAHTDLLAGLVGHLPAGTHVLAVELPPEIVDAYGIDPPRRRVPAGIDDWEGFLAANDPAMAPDRRSGSSMIYTSGTTGRPKGVRRLSSTPEEVRQTDEMRRMIYRFRDGLRTVICCPLYHSAPNLFAVRAVRHNGLVLLQPRFDAEGLLELIDRERITHLFVTPTMFVRLLKLRPEVRARYDVSSLESVIHAGAPCSPDIKRAMIAWFGPVIGEYYGGTESGPVTFCTSEEWLAHPGTVGRAISGATVKACDDDGKAQPPGQAGEIFMRTHFYPDFTYHRQDEARRAIERDGLITCGDVGFLDSDGYLYICDRKRDMVISGGVNIYPAEIESVLVTMDGVRDCAVFGIPDDDFGESLIALIEPIDGQAVSPDAVREFLGERLADYKVPRRIEIRDGLPREDSGKIFKRLLREPYWRTAGRAV